MADEEIPYLLIISRGLYWRPDFSGYTMLRREAGLYTDAQARQISDATGSTSSSVPKDRAAEFAPAATVDAIAAENSRKLGSSLQLMKDVEEFIGNLPGDATTVALHSRIVEAIAEAEGATG